MSELLPLDYGNYTEDYLGIEPGMISNKTARTIEGSSISGRGTTASAGSERISFNGPAARKIRQQVIEYVPGDFGSDDEMDIPVINSGTMQQAGWSVVSPKKRWRSSVTYEMPKSTFYQKYGKPGYRDDTQKAAYSRLLEGVGRYRYKRRRYYRPYRRYRRRFYRRRGLYYGREGNGLYGNGFYGRGRFNFGNWLKKAGRTVGHGLATASRFANRHAGDIALAADVIAPEIAPEVGEALALNKAFHAVKGRGQYSIEDSEPNMNSMFTGSSVGMVGGVSENQDVTISHCEYLQDVYGPPSANFLNQSIQLNPGLSYNIPWLAQIAANYEEYEFLQLVFEFRSTVDPSATNNSSGATGTLIMATNYNPDAPQFATKSVMMDYHGSQSGRVTEDMLHGVECNPAMNAGTATKYVRTRDTIESKKDFDLGKFQFAIVNIPPSFFDQQIGELWVTYTVRLQKPRLYVAVGRQLPFDRTVLTASTVDGQTLPLIEKGQQATNILGTQTTGTIAQNGNDVDCQTELLFPNYMTGTFEVVITVLLTSSGAPYVTGSGSGFNIGASSASIEPVNLNGSLEVYDMYLGALEKGEMEDWSRTNYSYGVLGVGQGLQNKFTLRTAIKVTPVINGATGVTDNRAVFRYWFQNGALAGNIEFNTAVTIKPINDTLPFVFTTPGGIRVNIPN